MKSIRVLTIILALGCLGQNSFGQCANDPRVNRFKNMNTNVQACSQCATLALYLCACQYAVKPNDIAQYRRMINAVKSNIRYMAPNNCCPELLGEKPRFGAKAGSGKRAGNSARGNTAASGGSSSGLLNDINEEDLAELGSAVVSSVELGLMAMDLIDRIFPDVSSAYRDAAQKFKYDYEESDGGGNGRGTIQFADPNYIFQGEIYMGYPKKGVMRANHYGVFTGEFNDRINAVTAREADIVGGAPGIGSFDYNFGVSNIFKITPDGEGDFYFQFDNGDRLSLVGKGLRKYAVYLDQSTDETYRIRLKYLRRLDIDEIEDEYPINDPAFRKNLCRYYLATAVRVMTLPKMLGRDVSNPWWQDQISQYIKGANYFCPIEPEEELSFWIKEVEVNAKLNPQTKKPPQSQIETAYQY